jgi:transcriptional regulator with XRE-family HTH domain
MHSGSNALGILLRSRREQLGLSIRAAAGRIGISPSYLTALEHGRNPSTGRPPVPSPPVVAALGRELGVETAALLDLVGAPVAASTHLLVYQAGEAGRSATAARRFFADRVDTWLEMADPRLAGPPDAARQALAERLAASRAPGTGRLGLIFAASSAALRAADDPRAALAREDTWEHDVAATCRAVLGAAPAANVCVYREADLQELAARLDPLTAALALVRTHPHVVAEDRRGGVTSGPAAIEAILTAARPAGTSFATWGALAGAAAIGLAREAAVAGAPGHGR